MFPTRLKLPAVAVAAACAGAACASRTPYNPWVVPQDRFFGQTSTIALWSVDTPDELERPEPVRATFDSLIGTALRGAGYTVVPSTETVPIWDRLVDSAGGLFDQKTGARDSTRVRLLRGVLLRELRTRFNTDAVLYPAIVAVAADFNEHKATWDGTSQTIEGTGSFILRALAGVSRSGTTEALSLAVLIEDMGGTDLFANRGGLEVWEKPGHNEFHRVPRAALFVDQERNLKGVQIALAPVLTRPGAAARP